MIRVPVADLRSRVGQTVTVAGWVHALRLQRAMQFVLVRDHTGVVQLTHRRDALAHLRVPSGILAASMLYPDKPGHYPRGAASLGDHVMGIAPVVVELPAEIDITNSEQVFGALNGALAPGVAVVIADMTSTVFCDSSGVRALLHAHLEAQARDVRLRLAIRPDSPVRRVLGLTGAHLLIPIYQNVPEAMAGDGD